MPEKKVFRSAAAMKKFAAAVASTLQAGDVVLLYGDLGAGKTTFVQGVAEKLGISDRITSPTFTIVGEYKVDKHNSIKKLIHVDLFRLSPQAAINDPAIRDILVLRKFTQQKIQADSGAVKPDREEIAVTLIEWADRLSDPPSGAIKIQFSHGRVANERIVSLSNHRK